jgi:hypothetical protein
MKRAGNLWSQLTSWENLLASALAAARGKRKRPDVARFLFNLEPNVCALQRELLAGEWRPGEYRTFWSRDPKPRMISAAPFRDRVVHHAVTRVLESVFEPRFTASSFASRKGFGQHKALQQGPCGLRAAPVCAEVRRAQVFPVDRSRDSEGTVGASDQMQAHARFGLSHHRWLQCAGGSQRGVPGRYAADAA